MASRRTLTNSPFDTLEKTFKLLVKGPNPLAFDASEIAGLPDQSIPFDELQAMLLHPSTSFNVRDAVIGALVARSPRGRCRHHCPGRDALTGTSPGRLGPGEGLPGQDG